MVFPVTQLPLRVKIAPGANPAADPITWPAWVDISNDVRIEQGVTISDGRPNEASVVDPGEATLTVDNRSGRYVVANPNSNLYPLLRRNCPIRIGTEIVTDNFNRTTSNAWGTPSGPSFPGLSWNLSGTASDWSTTGTQGQINMPVGTAKLALVTGGNAYNVEGKATLSVSVVATGDSLNWGIAARYIDSNNYYQIHLRFNPGGTLQLNVFRILNGSANNVPGGFVTIPGTYAANTRVVMRWQVNGANILAKAWLESGSEPANWQMSINDDQVVKGGGNGLIPWRQPSNTNVGTVLMSVDDYTLESIEWSGNLTELPVRWDQSGRDSTAPLKANGVLRRLQQGSTLLKSPLYRQLIAQSPSGYWPLEDDSGVIAPSTPLPAPTGVKPAQASGVTFGVDSDLAGAARVVQFNAVDGILSFYPNSNPTNTGFAAMFFFKFNALPGVTLQQMVSIFVNDGPVRKWTITANNTQVQITGFAADGTAFVPSVATTWNEDPLGWIAVEVKTTVVGANTNWEIVWNKPGKATWWTMFGSYASTVAARCTGMQLFANTVFNGMFVSHAWIGANTLPFVDYTFLAVSAGYAGELASARITRLCREEGVLCYAEPGSSEPMGVQTIAALMTLLRECETTDFGVLYEDGFGLGYRPRSQRYGKAVDVTLDVSQGHLAAPPEPTIDDQAIRNTVAVSRPGGAQNVVATDPVNIANEGTYTDSVTVNTQYDLALPYHGQWRVYLGTRPDMRLARISLDMARNTLALLSQWRGRPRWGGRAIMTNVPSQLLNQAPDMIIEGCTQTLNAFQWDVDANTSPAVPWDVAVADSTALGRADTAGSQLTTAVNTSIGTFIVATTVGPVWRTGAYPSTPLVIEGEIVALTNVASATSPQTFTVTRSVNSVVKTHGVGASISLAYPARAAL